MYQRISFNQDQSCAIYIHEKGFMIYDIDPFMERWGRSSEELGCDFLFIEMLYKTNILAVVADDRTSQGRFAKNKLVIWDDHLTEIIGSLEFKDEIKVIKMNRHVVAVGTTNKIYIVRLSDLSILVELDAHSPNVDNLCISDNENWVVAFPISNNEIKIYGGTGIHQVNIVKSKVQIMTIHKNLLAIASERGTILKIVDTSGKMISSYRRGIYGTRIVAMAFDSENEHLVVTSEKGTLHVFKLEEINQKSRLASYLPDILKPDYLNSEWSSLSLHLGVTDAICCFLEGGLNTRLVVVSQQLGKPIKLKIEDDKILKIL